MELLLELFGEEIPARMQLDALAIGRNLDSKFKEIFAQEINTESWVTPRRIGFVAHNVPANISTKEEELRGPKADAPEQALQGFIRKYNLKQTDLHQRDGYYYSKITTGFADINTALSHTIESVLNNFVWPKSMRWSNHEMRWVRPLHSILCILDGKVLPINFGHIKSSNTTQGHRFHAPEKFQVSSYENYYIELKNRCVIIEPKFRLESIINQTSDIIKSKGLKIINEPALLDEIVGLVEKPTVYLGEIPAKFMSLPREVLVIALKHHQRYLMLNHKDGSLAPYFIIVSNLVAEDGGKEIISGNQKVLNARLSDANFFLEQDSKIPLADLSPKLDKLTFHNDIGSVLKKQQSVLQLAKKLAEQVNDISTDKLLRAVNLAKCDLVTNMVKEFPQLQGIMGYYYALHHNEDKDVAIAIRDHYKPQGPSDHVPENKLGALTALAEKLDTLEQMFAINIKPTGSKDPFALRRAAIGVLRIIEEHKLPIDLAKLDLRTDVLEFIKDRRKINDTN